MKTLRRSLPTVSLDTNVVSLLAAVVALVVFAIDAFTPLDIAVAVFYVVVVLLVASTGNRAATHGAAWGCVVLTLLGFVLSHDDAYSSGAVARCVVSLLAIATTSILALRNLAATATLQEQVELLNLEHDAIVVHDMNDRVTFWNRGAEALYGWTAQQALERSEALLRDAQRLSRTGSIAVRFPEGEMWWSDEAYRIFDYARETVPSVAAILARTYPDDRALVLGVFEQAAGGASQVDVEHRLAMPDGSVKHVHYVAYLTTTQSGEREYVGALMDVTETKRAQEALARSNDELAHVTRITMLGELAASIAHEVTQPIAAILTCGAAALRWLNRPTPELDEAAQSVAQMIRDAKRADEVIQRIRSVAKRRDRLPATVDVNAIVGESIELVRAELERHRIELHVDLAAPSLMACCDRVQLQQVMINLILNSVQAMAEAAGPRKLTIVTRQFDDGQAQVIVQDSGMGISQENAGCLFNPFFTTKAEGMGMGLSICRSIVEAHGGGIWAESPQAGGAVLQFILPVDEGRCHEQ
ncbi:PAS domain S-box-containing protein [Paraburkholderia phenazinium]|uniref:histidine kinase n=1 Tax=Paraburkholderia phenazinium TaxID=60549 RepID=A0A1G7RT61_9BURK|nr:ATP-binding protein [Paraburkholderia phenazinium]SDG13844.1 PAS domain S-box-containing protein [Paraburkholderia phenazinium]